MKDDLNDAEPDAALHIAFPPPHNVVQDLKGLKADMRSDDRQEQNKSENYQRKNHANNSKKIKGNQKSEKSDQVFTVSKADFERLNSWKATKSKQSNGPKKSVKPAANESKSAGICYNFQNHGECKRLNFPYQHVVKKNSETKCRWFPTEAPNLGEVDEAQEDKQIQAEDSMKIIAHMKTGSIHMIITIL